MLDWEEGLVEVVEEMVEVGLEEDEDPAIAEETVWDISGCIWERMEAIRSDCEDDDDPEEDVDVDPDDCCPATADVTV